MLDRDYRDAMRQLTGLYPDDLDAAALYAESIMDLHAWSLWTSAGKPTEGTEELLAVLQSVLRRDPKHPGANHFYIHALEASPHPETALASAHVLETLVPGAGHLLHMPSHIYIRLGNYAQAVKANEAAASADRAYLRATGTQDSVYGRMYYSHDLLFLWIAASMEGKFSEAKQAADELSANVSPAVRSMPMLEALLGGPALVLTRFQRWDDILNLPAPEVSLAGARAYWRYSRGVAFSAKGAISKAQAERQELAALVNQPASGTSSGHSSAPAAASLAWRFWTPALQRPRRIIRPLSRIGAGRWRFRTPYLTVSRRIGIIRCANLSAENWLAPDNTRKPKQCFTPTFNAIRATPDHSSACCGRSTHRTKPQPPARFGSASKMLGSMPR